MADLSSKTVAQLKEELQQKGVDVKGLKLKKDYIEKLQAVLDAGSDETKGDAAARGAKREEEVDELDPSSGEEEGKHVSATHHAEALQDPETALPPASTVVPTEGETESVKEAKEDSSIAITKEDKNEQILGDADGDLGEKMEAAAKAGKAERLEGQDDPAGRTESEEIAVEEMKEEGNDAVDAAEAQPPQVAAQQEVDDTAVTETPEVTMDQDAAQTEKRKREDDDGSKDGKRARLSPGPTRDSSPDTPAEAAVTSTSPNRPPQDETTHPLPDKLSHVSHPATRALYISNLRRPLLLPDLKAWLIEQGSSDGVQEQDVLDGDALPGGVWLDGVKSHCYCIFKTTETAIAAAARIQGQVFPIDHGVALTVEFVPEGTVPSLVSQEKAAWENGRNKMVLEITKGTGFGGSDYSFNLVPPKGKDGVRSSGGLGDLRPPRATPASRPPELGGVPTFGVAAGRPEFRPPPSNNGWGARGNRDDPPGLQKTRTQPILMYRESPKYAAAVPRFDRPQRDSGSFGSQPRPNGPQGNWGRSNDRGWGRPAPGGW